MERAGSVGWGWGIVRCHVTSQQNLRIAPRRINDLWYLLCEQKVYQVVKFMSMCVQYGDKLSLLKVCMSGLKWPYRESLGLSTTAITAQNEDVGIWFWKADEWQLTELQNNWISALGLPILWCMVTISSIKCAPDGYLRNWWMSISTCA
jgi:hypothetical protein